jgi:hypothetical protein
MCCAAAREFRSRARTLNKLVLVQTPNFGMLSLTEPQPNPLPSPITAEALQQQSAPAEWAGTGSQTYLMPLKAEAVDALPVAFKPPYKLHWEEEAPFNVLLDWAFGVRIIRTFGTSQARAVTQRSTLR